MKLKSFIFALTLTPLVLFAQFADHRPDPGEIAKHRTEKMVQELDLTPEQATQVEAINLELSQKIHSIHESGERSVDSREQMKALRESHKAELEKILTADQMQTLDAKMQSRKEHRQMKKGHRPDPAMKQEMHAYAKENIHPVIVEQRFKLDEMMSKKDRKKVKKLRKEMQALRDEGMAMRKEFKQSKGECTPGTCKEDKKAEFKAHHEKMKPIMDEAQKIADKYATEIEALKMEIKPDMQQWKADMKAMKDKYGMQEGTQDGPGQMGSVMPPHGPRRGQGPPPGMQGQRFGGKHQGHRKGGHGFKKMLQPAHFVLMDPNAPFPEMKMRQDEASTGTANPGLTRSKEIKLYPNPSPGISKLEYTVEAPGVVKIELLDKNARAVEVLMEAHKDAGTHTLEINTETLKNHEVYIFRVTDAAGTGTQRVLIKR